METNINGINITKDFKFKPIPGGDFVVYNPNDTSKVVTLSAEQFQGSNIGKLVTQEGNLGDLGFVGDLNSEMGSQFINSLRQKALTPQDYAVQQASAGGATANQLNNLVSNYSNPVFNEIPNTQAPTSASQVTNSIGNINLPTTIPGMGNIAGATSSSAGAQSYIDTQAQIAKDRQEQIQKQMELLNTQTKPFLDRLLGSLSPEQARLQAQQQTGIDPEQYFADQKAKIAEIGVLTEQYNATKAQMEQQLAQTQDKMGSMNFINNQTAQIQRNAAPVLNQLSANINSKSAVLQALQGNFAEARNFVNQAVQDATAEYKYNADMYTTFYELNKDIIETLDAPYKEAYTAALNLAQSTYEQSLKDKTTIGEMMIDPALRNSGITMADTLEQAYAKAAKVAGPNYVASQQLIHGGSGGSGTTSGGAFNDIIQAAINEGASPEEAARAAAAVSEAQGIQVDESQLNKYLAAARNMKKITTPNVGLPNTTTTPVNLSPNMPGLNFNTPLPTGSQTSQPISFSGTTLKVGSSGEEVKKLQQALGITADGNFGPQTKAAVIAYQKANGLTPDGIVGSQTLASLGGTSSFAGTQSTQDSFFSNLFG